MNDYETHKFLKLLDKKRIKYRYDGRWLIIERVPDIDLSGYKLESLPDYIKFNNNYWVDMSGNELKSLPDNIEFNNDDISLSNNKLTSLPDNIKFNNRGQIYLYGNPLESLPDNIDEWYNKLSIRSQEFLQEKFPEHWFFDKERFGL